MIEIGLGLVAILTAAAIALGLADAITVFPLGSGVATTIAIPGVVLAGHGIYRVLRRRSENSHRLRSIGLMLATTGLTLLIALTLPALSELMNLLKIAGFPLGLYAMGQGALIVFVALLFVFAGWQSRIDDADGA